MNNIPFILTFGSCGWDRILCKNEDGTEEFISNTNNLILFLYFLECGIKILV